MFKDMSKYSFDDVDSHKQPEIAHVETETQVRGRVMWETHQNN